jgi:hypothetical protein
VKILRWLVGEAPALCEVCEIEPIWGIANLCGNAVPVCDGCSSIVEQYSRGQIESAVDRV